MRREAPSITSALVLPESRACLRRMQ